MHIILLRGLAREAMHWLEFPKQLQTAINGSQLHLIDFPGCGKYYQQTALGSITDMTEHARAEVHIQSLIAQAPVFIIGISMGGMVALDWAQRYPHELNGLVLINSSSGNQPFWWRLKPGAWLTMLRTIFAAPDTREKLVLKVVSNQRADYRRRAQQWLDIQQQRPITRSTILSMLRAAARFRPQPYCAADGLVLASAQDRMVSVHASEALAKQFHWPLNIHPSAGHDLPMDDAAWVADKIRQWLNRRHIKPA